MEADDLEDGIMRTIIATYTYRHMLQKAKQVTQIIVAGKVDNDFSLAAIVQHLRRQLLPVGYEPLPWRPGMEADDLEDSLRTLKEGICFRNVIMAQLLLRNGSRSDALCNMTLTEVENLHPEVENLHHDRQNGSYVIPVK